MTLTTALAIVGVVTLGLIWGVIMYVDEHAAKLVCILLDLAVVSWAIGRLWGAW